MSSWPFGSAWPLKARGAGEGLSSKLMPAIIACTLPLTAHAAILTYNNVFALETLRRDRFLSRPRMHEKAVIFKTLRFSLLSDTVGHWAPATRRKEAYFLLDLRRSKHLTFLFFHLDLTTLWLSL